MKVIIVAGKFDPIHAGHVASIVKASKLGDYLIVVTHRDDIVAKTSAKGFCAVPLYYRCLLLQGILLVEKIKGIVLVGIDEDGTMVKTLEMLKVFRNSRDNLVYAKGGDRTLENMNKREIEVCGRLGIQIEYGIGDLLSSSSQLCARMGDKVDF